MTQSPRSGVNQQNNFTLCQIESRSGRAVEDFVYVLHFEKMIPRSECSKLRFTSQFGAGTYSVRIGSGDASSFFRVVEVGFGAHVVFDRPSWALLKNLVQITVRYAKPAVLTSTGRHVAKELMHQIAQPWLDVLESKGAA